MKKSLMPFSLLFLSSYFIQTASRALLLFSFIYFARNPKNTANQLFALYCLDLFDHLITSPRTFSTSPPEEKETSMHAIHSDMQVFIYVYAFLHTYNYTCKCLCTFSSDARTRTNKHNHEQTQNPAHT